MLVPLLAWAVINLVSLDEPLSGGGLALLVGGIGVATGVRAWLDQRARTIATLRCLGAPARLSLEEELRFLDQAYAQGGQVGLMMQTLLETGARVSEFVTLRIGDVTWRLLDRTRVRWGGVEGVLVENLQLIADGVVAVAGFSGLRMGGLTFRDIDAVVLGKAPDMFEGVMEVR